jgi:hypothetical protein
MINKFTLCENNKRATCNSGCDQDKKVFSNESLPSSGIHYWEILKNHTTGCYDSIGLTTNYSLFNERNGLKSDGWAVRLYGDHSDKNFTGWIHDGS